MPRFSYSRVLVVGLGILGIHGILALYSAQIPIILQAGRPDFEAGNGIRGYGFSTTWTGFVMTLDNLAALLILPYIGIVSDRTRTRWGRRKPFITVGAPIAATAFVAIPLLAGGPLVVFMTAIATTIIGMSLLRTPLGALMPDLTPSPRRSQANGIIIAMAGLGGLLAFVVGGALFDIAPWVSFAYGSGAMLAACMLVVLVIHEPAVATVDHDQADAHENLYTLLLEADRSVIALLLAQFLWWFALSSIEVFWTSFASDTLGMTPGQATQLLGYFSFTIIGASIPVGFIAVRLGRKRTIMLGVAGLAGVFMGAYSLRTPSGAIVVLALAGLAWALIEVNSWPMLLDLASSERAGSYTGLYFLSAQSAAIVGPVMIGAVIDLAGTNYRIAFVPAAGAALLALACLLRVRGGEAKIEGTTSSSAI